MQARQDQHQYLFSPKSVLRLLQPHLQMRLERKYLITLQCCKSNRQCKQVLSLCCSMHTCLHEEGMCAVSHDPVLHAWVPGQG